MGGISGENIEKTKTLKFDFLPQNVNFKLTLISDSNYDKAFKTQYLVVNQSSSVEVKMLRRGGFVASLAPLQ